MNNPLTYVDPTGYELELLIRVDQPGDGGNRDSWTFRGGCGHAMFELRDTDTGETTGVKGFYPTTSKFYSDGQFHDDTEHDYEVEVVYNLTKKDYDKAKAFIESELENTPIYDLDGDPDNMTGLNEHNDPAGENCAGEVIKIARAANVIVPQTKYNIPGPAGETVTPGNLGEDLKELKDYGKLLNGEGNQDYTIPDEVLINMKDEDDK